MWYLVSMVAGCLACFGIGFYWGFKEGFRRCLKSWRPGALLNSLSLLGDNVVGIGESRRFRSTSKTEPTEGPDENPAGGGHGSAPASGTPGECPAPRKDP